MIHIKSKIMKLNCLKFLIGWLPALLLLPSVLMAQVKERQAGDTTYYKTLIPETKQGLLKKCEHDSKHEVCTAE